jgi:ribosomal protein S4E
VWILYALEGVEVLVDGFACSQTQEAVGALDVLALTHVSALFLVVPVPGFAWLDGVKVHQWM